MRCLLVAYPAAAHPQRLHARCCVRRGQPVRGARPLRERPSKRARRLRPCLSPPPPPLAPAATPHAEHAALSPEAPPLKSPPPAAARPPPGRRRQP
eukprot:6190267-Pleurochrysis_carterae.AAC.2